MTEVKKTTILVTSIKRRDQKNTEGNKTMSLPEDRLALSKAFSGILGVDEKSILEVLVKCQPEHLTTFRKEASIFFSEDEHSFERWMETHLAFLEKEFLRFQNAVVQWTMHPWERDARLARKAVDDGPQSYGLLIELACTRSSEELLGTRKAYQSLYDESIEEDVASRVKGTQRKLLVALVTTYRYEGPRINDVVSKSEAQKLGKVIRNGDKKKLMEDDETLRILTTRNKLHLKSVYKYYKYFFDKNIDEELDEQPTLKDTITCLCAPSVYFSKVLDSALKENANENAKEALTRVIVTRTNVDMKDIAEEYKNRYEAPLTKKIENIALGNYKDFLVTLIQRAS